MFEFLKKFRNAPVVKEVSKAAQDIPCQFGPHNDEPCACETIDLAFLAADDSIKAQKKAREQLQETTERLNLLELNLDFSNDDE